MTTSASEHTHLLFCSQGLKHHIHVLYVNAGLEFSWGQHQITPGGSTQRRNTFLKLQRDCPEDSSCCSKNSKLRRCRCELALRGAVHKSFLKQGKTNKLTKNQRRLITDMVEKRKKGTRQTLESESKADWNKKIGPSAPEEVQEELPHSHLRGSEEPPNQGSQHEPLAPRSLSQRRGVSPRKDGECGEQGPLSCSSWLLPFPLPETAQISRRPQVKFIMVFLDVPGTCDITQTHSTWRPLLSNRQSIPRSFFSPPRNNLP